MAAGKFITFEGGEGAGKSTQARLLAARLIARGRDVVVTREPGGAPCAEAIRQLLLQPGAIPADALTEALLFNAARADHLVSLIRPALARGADVLCDRFADSTRAYQGAAGNLQAATIDQLEAIVVGPTRPDLTLVLDLEPAAGLVRANVRRSSAGTIGTDQFEGRGLGFHERLRPGFLAIAAAEPQRCLVVTADGEADAVGELVWRAVAQRLGL